MANPVSGIFKTVLEMFSKGEKAGEKLAKTSERVEPPLGAIDGAATNLTEQAAKEAEKLATKTAASRTAMNSILGDLNPSLFGKEEFVTNLKTLETTANKHELIDGKLVSNRSAKKIESALSNGEHISPNELRLFKESKIKEFDDYADNQARKTISLDAKSAEAKAKAITQANKTGLQKVKDYTLGTLAAALGVPAIAGVLYTAYDTVDTFAFHPKNPGTVGRMVQEIIKSVPGFGNGVPGDNYAEFLKGRYGSKTLGSLSIKDDLKAYYEINYDDFYNINNLPEKDQNTKKMAMLEKLIRGPIHPMPQETSADIRKAINMYVTDNLNMGSIAATDNDLKDLLGVYSTKQFNKNSASALTAPPVNIGNAIGGNKQTVEVTVEETRTPIRLDEKTLNIRLNQMVEDFYIKPDEKTKLQAAWKTASTKPNASEVFLQNSTEILSDPSVGRPPEVVELVQKKIGGVDNTR